MHKFFKVLFLATLMLSMLRVMGMEDDDSLDSTEKATRKSAQTRVVEVSPQEPPSHSKIKNAAELFEAFLTPMLTPEEITAFRIAVDESLHTLCSR